MLEYTYNPVDEQLNIAKESRTFQGYVRKNGEVGVRNEVWVVPTGRLCERCCRELVELLKNELAVRALMPSTHGTIISAVLSFPVTTRILVRDP